jgi:hypothetical protein
MMLLTKKTNVDALKAQLQYAQQELKLLKMKPISRKITVNQRILDKLICKLKVQDVNEKKPKTTLELAKLAFDWLNEYVNSSSLYCIIGDVSFIDEAISRDVRPDKIVFIYGWRKEDEQAAQIACEYGCKALRWDDEELLTLKFDVIVGNPPYNPKKKERSGGSGSGSKIWPLFVESAFELLKDDGYVLFITPTKWREGNFRKKSLHKNAQQVMWENTILRYQDVKEYFKSVGHSIGIDAWLVQKGEHQTNIPQKSLKKWKVLPRNQTFCEILLKYLSICEKNDVFEYLDTNREVHFGSTKTKEEQGFHFKHANTSAQTQKRKFLWFDKQTIGFDKPKVIVSDSGAFYPWFDNGMTGLGGSHSHAYIVKDENEGKALVDFLNSQIVKFIASQFMQECAIMFPCELFMRIPKAVVTQGIDVFGFTPEELQIINGKK